MRKGVLKTIFAIILVLPPGFLRAQAVLDPSRPMGGLTKANPAGFTASVEQQTTSPITTIYKKLDDGSLSVQLNSFSGKSFSGYNELRWGTGTEQRLRRFVIEYSDDGVRFQAAGELRPHNLFSGNDYTFRHYINNPGKLFYRLLIEDESGSGIYSPVARIGDTDKLIVKISTTIISNGRLEFAIERIADHYSIYDRHGALVKADDINIAEGSFNVSLPALENGVYWLRVDGKDWTETHRFIIR